jgi:glycosyltransferase involved in cell wall biosynthesis
VLEERFISVIVPCWNEASNVEFMVSGIRQVALEQKISIRVVFVDDGSDDSTWKMIETVCAQYHQGSPDWILAEGIRLAKHSGKNIAQAIGLRHCLESRLVVFMDGDGQHPISSIPILVKKAEESGQPVVASRLGYTRNWVSSVGVRILRILMKILGIPFFPDLSEYLVLPRASAVTLAGSPRLGVTPVLELVQSLLGPYSTVSVEIEERGYESGGSRWNLTELWRKALLQVLADPWRLLPRMTFLAVVAFAFLLVMVSVSAVHAVLQGTSPGTVAILFSIVVLAAISVGMWVASIVVSVLTLRVVESRSESVSYELSTSLSHD